MAFPRKDHARVTVVAFARLPTIIPFEFQIALIRRIVKKIVYTSRFVRVILAQGPC
jgi:hypothetical protein